MVTNGGPGSASAVTLRDMLNSKLSSCPPRRTVGTCAYASGSRTVTCSIGDAGERRAGDGDDRRHVAGKGNVANIVTVTSSTPDPNTLNNTATISIKLR